MCIIIDANVVDEIKRRTEDAKPVLNWLLSGSGGLVIGGKITAEITKSDAVSKLIIELGRAGKLHTIKDQCVNQLSQKIKGTCRSNDPHIIALAIIANCRLIYSHDKDLHEDAKNSSILSPPASIYQRKKHRHLLKKCNC